MAKKYKLDGDKAGKLLDVPLDAVGKAANAYMVAFESFNGLKNVLNSAGANLVRELRAAGRQDIKVKGVRLTIKSIEAKTVIQAKKAKD